MKALACTRVNPQEMFYKERQSHRFYQDIVSNKVTLISVGKTAGKANLVPQLTEDNPHFVLGYN